MEGPGCPRTAGSVRAVPTRGSFLAGQRRPGCSSSLRAGFGEWSRKWGGGPALRWPGSSEFRASLLNLLARVTASAKPEEGRACEPVGVTAASLDARGGTAARPPPRTVPGLPARARRPLDSGARFARKPTACSPALGVTSERAGHGEAAPEWIGGRRGRTPGPAGASGWEDPGGPWVLLQHLREPASTPDRWRARASRPRAPGSIFSPH